MVLKIIFKDIMSSIFPLFLQLIHVYTGKYHYQNKVKFSIKSILQMYVLKISFTQIHGNRRISASTVNFFTTFRIICQKLHDELSLKITVYALPTNRLV